MTQMHLIDKIISTANLDTKQLNDAPTPASGILHKHQDSCPRRCTFQLPVPDWSTQLPGCHNKARHHLCNPPVRQVLQCPMKGPLHMAAKRIVRYLKGTRTKGLILDFEDKPQIVKCFADANFAGAWDNTDPDEASNVKSRTGFLIKFAGCPIFWSSKQQELTALSTIEAEYIALSSATRHVLFILHLLEDLKALHIDFQLPETKVYAKCFEDNAGCLELAKAPKLRPRTKHIAVKFHHFLGYVKTDANPDGILELHWIPTDRQEAGWIYQSLGTHFVCQDPGTHHGMVTQTPGFKRECKIIITSRLCRNRWRHFFPTSCTVFTACVTQSSKEGGYLFIPELCSHQVK